MKNHLTGIHADTNFQKNKSCGESSRREWNASFALEMFAFHFQFHSKVMLAFSCWKNPKGFQQVVSEGRAQDLATTMLPAGVI